VVCLYQLSKQKNYDFFVDVSYHPIRQFLNYQGYHLVPLPDKNRIKFIKWFRGAPDISLYIARHFETNDVLFLCANCSIDTFESPISDDCRQFLLSILNFRMELFDVPTTRYNILHIRLRDKHDQADIKRVYKIFVKNVEPDDFLMSNSTEFKKYVSKQFHKFPIQMMDLEICHFGECRNEAHLKNTLSEYILASRARFIKTFSDYWWTSGFMNSISVIYNIPLINLKSSL